MKRIAIVGGGTAGLAAAYELEKQRLAGADLDWQLYEAAPRLGGLLSTTRIDTPEGRFVLEDGPDGWLTAKPSARDLAIELGLADQIIPCHEDLRRTMVLVEGKLQPMPPRMRMMVPEDLATLEGSPLFSDSARAAYAAELASAETYRISAPDVDESVASFILRHFGREVLEKIGAPLLSGIFGGNVEILSVRAVMPAFIQMERDHGSLIAALQAQAKTCSTCQPLPTFTTLRNGMGTLAEALIAKLPADRLHLQRPAYSLKREGKQWCLRTHMPDGKGKSKRHYHHILLATPIDVTRALLAPVSPAAAALIPTEASSAVLATFAWPAAQAAGIALPEGFGFLVPHNSANSSLLAATFADQKYPCRAPAGARILRAFFGGPSAEAMMSQPDETIAAAAHQQFSQILGKLPAAIPALTTIRRWPRSLPQYAVGHLDRMAELDTHITHLGGLTLLGNGYRGVGVPDLIRDARAAAKTL